MTPTRTQGVAGALAIGALAGVMGGLAEIGWIGGLLSMTGDDPSRVATAVTATLSPGLGMSDASVWLGLVIHMALAIGLGIIVATAMRTFAPRLAGTLAEAAIVVAILGGVWAMNFLVVLPMMNPDFVHIVPMPVSFASKLLFGVAAALVLLRNASRVSEK